MKYYIKKAQNGTSLYQNLGIRTEEDVDRVNQQTKNRMKGLWKGLTSGTVTPSLSNIGNLIESTYKYYIAPEITTQGGVAPSPGLIRNPSQIVKRGRLAIKASDLAKRKFFPIEEYGEQPIYSRNTLPKSIRLRDAEDITNPTLSDDITYMNENFGGQNFSTMEIARKRIKSWKESPHGRAIGFASDNDLSTDSWPQMLKFAQNRHLDGTGTAFVPNDSGQTESFLNTAGHTPITEETVRKFNEMIADFNKATGLNLSKARFVPEQPLFYPDGSPIITKITGKQASTPARIYVPNIGLVKHKHGAKIMPINRTR